MANPSPNVLINTTLAPPQDVTANATFTVQLASALGAQLWALSCISTDELNTAAAINASFSIAGSGVSRIITVTAPALGSCMVFSSQVGVQSLGLDGGGNPLPGGGPNNIPGLITFQVNVKTLGGNRVFSANEFSELDPVFGWISKCNTIIRALSPSGSNQTENRILVNAGNTPYTAGANTCLDVDSSSVAITINMPALTPGQFVSVKLQTNPATHNVTVNAPSGKTIENPPGIGGGMGTLSSSVVFNAAAQLGDNVFWEAVATGSPYGNGNLAIR